MPSMPILSDVSIIKFIENSSHVGYTFLYVHSFILQVEFFKRGMYKKKNVCMYFDFRCSHAL